MPVIKLTLTAVILAVLSSGFFLWVNAVQKLDVQVITEQEKSWQHSELSCKAQKGNWHLPDILELMGIFYFREDIKLNRLTDYWSRSVILGRGFGLNTRYGILSYDVLSDIDHFLCVRDITD